MVLDLDISDSEFNDLMLSIEAQLKSDNIPFVARPIAALGEIGKRLKKEIPLSDLPSKNGRFTPPIVAKVNQWYETRYEDLLSMHLEHGKTIILVKGDVFSLSIPYCAGGVFKIVCDKEYKKTETMVLVKKGENPPPLEVNLLTCITDLPKGIALSLTEPEMRTMIHYACNVFNAIYALKSQDLQYSTAIADLETSANHILSPKPQYGLSQWSSLQFVEKIMKSYIIKHGGTHGYTHKLEDLNKLLMPYGKALSRGVLMYAQCEPAIRYNPETATRLTAIQAHQAALVAAAELTTDQMHRAAVFIG